jgi:hypothetical protein
LFGYPPGRELDTASHCSGKAAEIKRGSREKGRETEIETGREAGRQKARLRKRAEK